MNINNSMFDKIQDLCNEKKISIAFLERTLNFGTSTISKWKNATPNSKQLLAVAKYFNVSLDYLMGTTSIPNTAENILNNKEVQTIHRGLQKMPCKDRERMMKILALSFEKYFPQDGDSNETR